MSCHGRDLVDALARAEADVRHHPALAAWTLRRRDLGDVSIVEWWWLHQGATMQVDLGYVPGGAR